MNNKEHRLLNVNLRSVDDSEEKMILEGKIEEQTVNVNKAEANVERARRKMADAMADRKTYEKLREKAFEEFVAEENRAEGKAVDELTSYKYSIKSDK